MMEAEGGGDVVDGRPKLRSAQILVSSDVLAFVSAIGCSLLLQKAYSIAFTTRWDRLFTGSRIHMSINSS